MVTHLTLQITATETRIFSAEADVRLPLGDSVIDGFVFQHSPVTAYEAEVAIEHIENRIIPARDLILHCPDPRLNYLLTGDDAGFLSTEETERAFNEIVNVISGSPVSSTSLPSDKQFTAFLLIIREITHHWGLTGLIPGTAGKNDVI